MGDIRDYLKKPTWEYAMVENAGTIHVVDPRDPAKLNESYQLVPAGELFFVTPERYVPEEKLAELREPTGDRWEVHISRKGGDDE